MNSTDLRFGYDTCIPLLGYFSLDEQRGGALREVVS